MKQRVPNTHSHTLIYSFVYSLTFVFLGITLIIYVVFDLPKGHISRDLAAIASVNPLLGFQSAVGGLVWFSSGAVCLFSSWLVANQSVFRARFLFWAGLISLVLGFDDLFMFHEFLFPSLGRHVAELLPALQAAPLFTEEVIFTLYVLGFARFAWVYRSIIANFDRAWLMLALAFFSLSLFIDIPAQWFNLPKSLFVEEGAKLLGIVGWGAYLCSVCYALLQETLLGSTS